MFYGAGLAAGFMIGLIVGVGISSKSYEKQAIQLGYAEYNSTNGVWQWKQKGQP